MFVYPSVFLRSFGKPHARLNLRVGQQPPQQAGPQQGRWLPTQQEVLASASVGSLGALLLAPLWVRKRLPAIRNTSLEKTVDALTDDTTHATQKKTSEFVTYIGQPAGIMMMIPFIEPRLILPGAAVSLLLAIGYLGSNVLSGMQEVWVRYQESLIRANLLASLSQAYKTSIQQKTQVDEYQHRKAQQAILHLLESEQVAHPKRYLLPLWPQNLGKSASGTPTPPSETNHREQHFALYPQNRAPAPRQALASAALNTAQGNLQPSHLSPPPQHPYQSPLSFLGASRGTLDAIAAGIGFSATSIVLYAAKAVHGFLRDKQAHMVKNAEAGLRGAELIRTTLAPKDMEGVLLRFFSKPEGFVFGGLFLTMGVMLATLRFLVEGLREIEVTRLNAETEKRYEVYKLTQLEPYFKALSEDEQLRYALRRLAQDLPELKQNPEALHQRVQRILDNIGLAWSAPNYYPMAPIVQLAPARS